MTKMYEAFDQLCSDADSVPQTKMGDALLNRYKTPAIPDGVVCVMWGVVTASPKLCLFPMHHNRVGNFVILWHFLEHILAPCCR